MRPRGFSLIEVTMVVLILAIAAAAVALNVRAPMANVGMRGCIDQVVSFDRLTRAYAREQDRAVRLWVDLGAGELRRTDEEGRDQLGQSLRLPRDYRLTDLRVAGRSAGGGSMALACSAQGLTPTYAVLLEGPGGRKQWLLFAGLSGQAWEAKDEREIEGYFEACQARPYAD